jgi:hypothetical protein
MLMGRGRDAEKVFWDAEEVFGGDGLDRLDWIDWPDWLK